MVVWFHDFRAAPWITLVQEAERGPRSGATQGTKGSFTTRLFSAVTDWTVLRTRRTLVAAASYLCGYYGVDTRRLRKLLMMEGVSRCPRYSCDRLSVLALLRTYGGGGAWD